MYNVYRHEYFELPNVAAGSIALLSQAEVDTAVIFVHGFWGDPLGTWANFHDLIVEGRYDWWQRCDVFFYRYASFEHQVAINEIKFRSFVDRIFPKVDLNELLDLQSSLDARRSARRYRDLVLVGHSEGGLIIRKSVLRSVMEYEHAHSMTASGGGEGLGQANPAAPLTEPPRLAKAKLRLFAPAIFGYRPAGILGIVANLPLLGRCIDSVLRYSPAYEDMQMTELLELRTRVEAAARKYPEFTALRAAVLWGENEHLLKAGSFDCDSTYPSATGKDHRTVCKPDDGYTLPLEFVCH